MREGDLLEQLDRTHWYKRIRQLKYEFECSADRPIYSETISREAAAPRQWGRRRTYSLPRTSTRRRSYAATANV